MQKCVAGVATFLAAGLLLAGCGSHGPRELASGLPSAAFARTALSDGAPDIALNVSADILRTHPNDAGALLTQGEALAALGRTQEAQDSFRRVLAREPGSLPAARDLGRLLLASDPAAAEALFQKIVTHQANDAAAWNDLGIARDLQARHEDAQADYRRALAASPNMTAATANLALSLSLGGHAAEGLQLLRPVAQAAGSTPRLRYDLAAVATMAGERATAAALLRDDLQPPKLQDALDGFAALSPTGP
jgi:Flp pilus assembly protein TadD